MEVRSIPPSPSRLRTFLLPPILVSDFVASGLNEDEQKSVSVTLNAQHQHTMIGIGAHLSRSRALQQTALGGEIRQMLFNGNG